jgi:chromosome segregation ATPase
VQSIPTVTYDYTTVTTEERDSSLEERINTIENTLDQIQSSIEDQKTGIHDLQKQGSSDRANLDQIQVGLDDQIVSIKNLQQQISSRNYNPEDVAIFESQTNDILDGQKALIKQLGEVAASVKKQQKTGGGTQGGQTRRSLGEIGEEAQEDYID